MKSKLKNLYYRLRWRNVPKWKRQTHRLRNKWGSRAVQTFRKALKWAGLLK